MMICSNCGQEIEYGAYTCPYCGAAAQYEGQQYAPPPYGEGQWQYDQSPPQYDPQYSQQYNQQYPEQTTSQYSPQYDQQYSRQDIPEPSRGQAPAPRGPKRFRPAPLNTKEPPPAPPGGLNSVRLLASFAWLTAVIGPIVVLLRTIRGVWEVIPLIIQGTITDVSAIVAESLERFSGSEGTWGRIQGIWEFSTDAVAGTGGGVISFIAGWLLLAALGLTQYVSIMIALEKNAGAAKGLLITNTAVCALGSFMCYRVIIRICNIIEVLQPPYDSIPALAIILAVIAVALWLAASVIYFIKSKQ